MGFLFFFPIDFQTNAHTLTRLGYPLSQMFEMAQRLYALGPLCRTAKGSSHEWQTHGWRKRPLG